MNYRIVVETEKSGNKIYYVQKRMCWYFWLYLRECVSDCRVRFKVLKDAEQQIQSDVNSEYEKDLSKIVSREFLNR